MSGYEAATTIRWRVVWARRNLKYKPNIHVLNMAYSVAVSDCKEDTSRMDVCNAGSELEHLKIKATHKSPTEVNNMTEG